MDETTNGYDPGALDQLAAALSKAQAELQPATESGRNPHLRTSYSTLADIWAACREPLTRNGLTVIQCPMPDEEGWVSLQTLLLHTSGQRLSSIIRIPVAKPDAQAFGACLSYCRRYALAAMVGVTTASEDDDGERAVERTLERQPDRQPDRQDRQESAGDRAATAPRPVAAETCPHCHAPANKPHTRACPIGAGKA